MTHSDLLQSLAAGTRRHFSSRASTAKRGVGLLAASLLATAIIAAILAPGAGAVSDEEELTRIGSRGSGAGELGVPNGLASDPVTGHLYVTESNNRISEFTPWGGFVKAFGWDVAPADVNEQQEVRVRAAEGQFRLGFAASTTPDITVGAGAAEVEAALNNLPSIGGVGGEVGVKAVPGTDDGRTPAVYVVVFEGTLEAVNVAELSIEAGATTPNGGIPTTLLEARTRADGHATTSGLESCTAESGCQAATAGAGAGQFSHPAGIAVDGAGDIYVKDLNNLRVQKFDAAGRFALMFGGEVNKTTGESLCTKAQLEGGDQCGGGIAGDAPGWFSVGFSSGVTLGSLGQLFVADHERIQRFSTQGEFEAEVPVPGETVQGLSFDVDSGDLYAIFSTVGIHRLDSVAGTEIAQLEGQVLIATDFAGNVYGMGAGAGQYQGMVVQYDAAGHALSPPACCQPPLLPNNPNQRFNLFALGTNVNGNLHVANFFEGFGTADSFIRVFGPPPLRFEGPPPAPPEISAQYATSVDRTGAVVGAEINPHFWSDAHLYVEYGTGKCSEGGCEDAKPLPPGVRLTTKQIDGAVKSPSFFLEGLAPGTTYHYRFVAESSGGGPVRGAGGTPGIDGAEGAFTTYPAAIPPKADCPNKLFRTGLSAPLPDCRAYEMVSPIDKNNGDIKALLDAQGYPTNLDQSSSDGNRFTYSSYRSFADPKSGPYVNQYMATRSGGVGWDSEAISPPQGYAAAQALPGVVFENFYKAFSADLCTSWLVVAAEPVLASNASDGYRELYRRDGCSGKSYESLTGVERSIEPAAFETELQDTSADGAVAAFRVREKLTEDAVSGAWQAYVSSKGSLRLLCVLPNGAPSGSNCSVGTGDSFSQGSVGPADLNRLASVGNALSTTGDRAYWTATDKDSGPGKIYLRLNPSEEQSEVSGGECTEPEKGCTLKVSETVSTKASHFLGASADGRKALFEVTEGNLVDSLYLFDSEASSSTLLAGETIGVAGASEDLSRVYFVSKEALGGDAEAGKPNLYLAEGGVKSFIATLTSVDVAKVSENGLPVNTAQEPVYRAARVSPDGAVLAFISTASLTGYDNTDQASGEASSEVYLYEIGASGPMCVSCNPSGARPQGRLVRLYANEPKLLPTAASIATAQSTHHSPRSLSTDGKRLFFNSYDSLIPRDTNGTADVYEWEAASGAQECREMGAELYVPSAGGCLSLISSGQSPQDSQFLDASPDGEDVFFTTNASLLPQDPGLVDVYDARVNGGLPAPPEPPGPCQGEACQIALPPPNDPTPASASFRGVGDPKPGSLNRRRCGKGKARRKGRCVAKRKQAGRRQHRRDANGNRRANR